MSAEETVLVVDDIPANLRVLRRILASPGRAIRLAKSGHQALRSVAADPPEIILLDITMPEMDGYEVCHHLKADPATVGIPVIFISALSETEDILKAFDAGAVDYISKPFRAEEVRARVKTHLELLTARREVERQNQELKRTQAQLVQSEKMAAIGVLTAGIAHELNNPINFIQSSANTLQKLVGRILATCSAYDDLDLTDLAASLEALQKRNSYEALAEAVHGTQELAGNIVIGAERAAEIVRGLRLFSRLDRAERELVDIHDGIDATIRLLWSRLDDRIELHRELGEIPKLMCFPGKLNQVVMNLLNNAVDAIGENNAGEITIRTTTVERDNVPYVALSISDTGSGITPEAHDHLFEPFFTTKAVGRGVGLGLSISHGIVEDHGGKFEVKNEPGSGATFTVLLPIVS